MEFTGVRCNLYEFNIMELFKIQSFEIYSPWWMFESDESHIFLRICFKRLKKLQVKYNKNFFSNIVKQRVIQGTRKVYRYIFFQNLKCLRFKIDKNIFFQKDSIINYINFSKIWDEIKKFIQMHTNGNNFQLKYKNNIFNYNNIC